MKSFPRKGLSDQSPEASAVPRTQRSSLRCQAAVVVLALLLLAPWLLVGHARAQQLSLNSNFLGQGVTMGELSDLALVSPTEGWAVGYSAPCSSSRASSCTPLLRHYLDGTWGAVALPFPGWLNTLSMLSATDGWAGGYDGLLLHYDGHTWQRVAEAQGATFLQLHMVSDTDGWAIGYPQGAPTIEVLHYDGHTWTPQALLSGLTLGQQYELSAQALAMVSPSEGWVVGALVQQVREGTPPTAPRTGGGEVILHYLAGQWSLAARIPDGNLTTISMASATEGWAMGNTEDTRPATPIPAVQQTPLVLRYTQGRWKQIANPIPNPDVCCLSTVTMRSVSDGWAAGPESGISPRPLATMLHYTEHQWKTVPMPVVTGTSATITRIAMTSATEGWAVGAFTRFGTPDRTAPLFLHYQKGVWSLLDA